MSGETLVAVGRPCRRRAILSGFPNSSTHVLVIATFLAACVVVPTSPADDSATTGDFFEEKIRPLFVTHCYECHHGAEAESGFRIDSRRGLLIGGEQGPAIIPGDANASRLIQAVRHSEEVGVQMPPSGKLAEHEIADLVAWVSGGADWPASGGAENWLAEKFTRHWAFQPLSGQEPPTDGGDWSDHPVDRFIRRKQVESGVTPVAQADRRSFLRRMYFDLIGLPPTFEQNEAFCRDSSPDTFTKVVDDLLQSPHYGERWGRHWMDVVRYADTAGDNADYPIPEMYLYRD